jgi:hypothetical protein
MQLVDVNFFFKPDEEELGLRAEVTAKCLLLFYLGLFLIYGNEFSTLGMVDLYCVVLIKLDKGASQLPFLPVTKELIIAEGNHLKEAVWLIV